MGTSVPMFCWRRKEFIQGRCGHRSASFRFLRQPGKFSLINRKFSVHPQIWPAGYLGSLHRNHFHLWWWFGRMFLQSQRYWNPSSRSVRNLYKLLIPACLGSFLRSLENIPLHSGLLGIDYSRSLAGTQQGVWSIGKSFFLISSISFWLEISWFARWIIIENFH